MKGTRSLRSKKEKHLWIQEHAEEIARAHNRGLSHHRITERYDTSEYYIYVALYLTGDTTLPKTYASSIKRTFGQMKSVFVRCHKTVPQKPPVETYTTA